MKIDRQMYEERTGEKTEIAENGPILEKPPKWQLCQCPRRQPLEKCGTRFGAAKAACTCPGGALGKAQPPNPFRILRPS